MLKDIIKNLVSKIEKSPPDKRYRNLVFKGGGVRGIAYLGALEILEERGILQNIERLAGTSAGAIAATLVSFRLSMKETFAIFDGLNLAQIAQGGNNEDGKALKILPLKNTEGYKRIFERYGWYSSEYLHQWLQAVIAKQCGGNGRATFNDFRRLGFRDLHIIAVNLSRRRAEDFSYETTPDVAVADAVRMSISIPIIFEALRFDGEKFGDGDYYVDGGLYLNYPISLFDQASYVKNKQAFIGGINWETLGLFLVSSTKELENEPAYPENIWEFLNLTIQCIYDSHQFSGVQQKPVDLQRSALINDCGVSPVMFNIERGGQEYRCLIESGRQAMRDFLNK